MGENHRTVTLTLIKFSKVENFNAGDLCMVIVNYTTRLNLYDTIVFIRHYCIYATLLDLYDTIEINNNIGLI